MRRVHAHGGRYARSIAGVCAGAALAIAGLAGCSSGGGAQADDDGTITVKYGVTSQSVASLPTIIGEAEGFFAEEGIELETVVTGQSGKVCQQLIAGALDLGECSTNDVVRTVAAGGPIKVRFFTSASVLPNKVYAKEGISSWADLEGKTIMVASQQDNTFYFTTLMADQGGLDFPDGVTVTYAGSSTDRFAALTSGTVDATILTAPYDFQAEKAGFVELDDLVEHLPPEKYYGNGVSTTDAYAEENPEVIEKIFAAEQKALDYMLDPANKEDVIATIKEVGKLDADVADELGEYIYERLIGSGYYLAGGEADPDGIQGVIDSTVALGFLDEGAIAPDDVYDTSLVLP
ncbi:ABC transporter substrate-binding protein [Microbacterium tumbae]